MPLDPEEWLRNMARIREIQREHAALFPRPFPQQPQTQETPVSPTSTQSPEDRILRLRKFSALPLIAALSQIRCGFELETHSSDGYGRDEAPEGELDEEAYEEAKDAEEERARTLYVKSFAYFRHYCETYNSLYREWGYKDWDEFQRRLKAKGWEKMSLSEYCADTGESEARILRELVSAARDSVHEYEYREEVDLSDHFDVPNVEVGYDDSVDGFEFRTIGGLRSTQFLTALKKLFRHRHNIDVGCSFHIHLSIPGIRHSYGHHLQVAMVEYLLEHKDEVPRSVLSRWEDGEVTRYFEPVCDTDKFNFVHFHGRQRTWEFRCFGNVKSWADGWKCLKLAIRALQHGYKVILGDAQLLGTTEELRREAMERRSETPSKLLKKRVREESRTAA